MRIQDLTPTEHSGLTARVATRNGPRVGRLSYGGTKDERRTNSSHWYLIIKTAYHPAFTESALSLQWEGGAAVELLEA